MKFSSVFLCSGHLAYYSIERLNPTIFTASLMKFNGSQFTAPPAFIELHREGKRWYGNASDELVKEIGFDIMCRESTQVDLNLRRSNAIYIKS